MSEPDPIVIAHRGASGYLPEHSLAAKALAHAMGADFLEQDVVLTADGIPIVLHDIYLDSTTDVAQRYPGRARADGRYYAIDFTLEEIRQLRLHERSEPGPDGRPRAVYQERFPLGPGMFCLPTLEEEIALVAGLDRSCGTRTGLYIELKAPNWHATQGQDTVAALLSVLQRSGYLQQPELLYLQCFDPGTLQRLRRELPNPIALIQLIGENDWGEDTPADFEQMRSQEGLQEVARYADGIGPWLHHIYAHRPDSDGFELNTLVEDAHALGLKVHPYTFRRDELPPGVESLQQLLDIFVEQAGVDGLFTDFPDIARSYLQLRGPGQ